MEATDVRGTLKKRAGRYSRWCNRYFNLIGNRLEYKLTEDAADVRATFDLAPGCRVTDMIVEGRGKKLYTFWLVWPFDKSSDDKGGDVDNSDEDEEGAVTSSHNDSTGGEPNPKGLKQLLTDQQQVAFREKKFVQKQIEKHHAHDKSVGMVPKVAAVALGGLLVGAFTAGIGLLPYIAVVGGFAVAGGSTALRYRRPMDSRLVLASDSEAEAKKWIAAITQAIQTLEKRRGPRMPSGVSARLVSVLIKLTSNSGVGQDHLRWRRCKSLENSVRILELVHPPSGFQCRRAHAVVPATPQEAFLALMETPPWPGQDGTLRVLQAIDNNTDIICVRLRSGCSAYDGGVVMRTLYLSRFWRMTDDGCYLITFNGVSVHDIKKSRKGGAIRLDDSDEAFIDGVGSVVPDSLQAAPAAAAHTDSDVLELGLDPAHTQPLFTAVLTIAPRKDHAEYDNEVPETLVCCSLQVSDDVSPVPGIAQWERGEREATSVGFIHACLVDLRRLLCLNKYSYNALDAMGNSLDLRSVSSTASLRSVSPRSAPEDASNAPDSESSNRCKEQGGVNITQKGAQEEKEEGSLVRDRNEGSIAAEHKPVSVFSQNALGPLTRRSGYPRRTLAQDIVVFTSRGVGFQGDPRSLSEKRGADQKSRPPLRKAFSQPSSADNGRQSPSPKLDSTAKQSPEKSPQADQTRERVNSFSISRSSVVNNEAAALRGQIAAKEYELHRLQRVAYKRNEPTAHDAMSLVEHQTNELEILKGRYHKLTGTTYEHVSTGRRSGPSSHLAGFASVHSMSSTSSFQSSSGHRSTNDTPAMLAPPHWLPTKIERAEWEAEDHMQSEKHHTDLSVVLLVSVCILATIFVANLLSTI